MAATDARPTSAAPNRGRSSASREPMTRARMSPRTISSYRQSLRRAAERYLRDRYEKGLPVTAAGFADYLKFTAPYLSRIAPHVLGVKLHSFLREQQLARAAKLLSRFELTAEEVALRSGFRSIRTFYRLFCARYGMPPGRYRQDKK